MERLAMFGARSQLLIVATALVLLAGMSQPRASVAQGRSGKRAGEPAIASASPGILYVDDSVPQSGDGSSWTTAYRFLQDALAFAAQPANGVTEIRVAQGLYKPD